MDYGALQNVTQNDSKPEPSCSDFAPPVPCLQYMTELPAVRLEPTRPLQSLSLHSTSPN